MNDQNSNKRLILAIYSKKISNLWAVSQEAANADCLCTENLQIISQTCNTLILKRSISKFM